MACLLVVTPLSFWTMLLLSISAKDVQGSPLFPAMFAFGDSLLDNGNNNNLVTLAKVTYPPYGIDFQGPTGRFSNGKTFVDILAENIGLPYLPPFSAHGCNISSGVNYASGGAGIMDQTGIYLGQHFSFSQQVENFEKTLWQLKTQMDNKSVSHYLAMSLTIVDHGNNDYLNNYLLPALYLTSSLYDPKTFAGLLIQNYSKQILALRGLGLRKFLLGGLGPIGCIPNQLATYLVPPGKCADNVNKIVSMFNVELRNLVDQLNSEYPGSIFVYGNCYGAMYDMINNPNTYGFTVTDSACCGIGRNRGWFNCLPYSPFFCTNRDQYVFWDAFHPTQAVSNILANRVLTGPPSDCYPINVKQMAQMVLTSKG